MEDTKAPRGKRMGERKLPIENVHEIQEALRPLGYEVIGYRDRRTAGKAFLLYLRSCHEDSLAEKISSIFASLALESRKCTAQSLPPKRPIVYA